MNCPAVTLCPTVVDTGEWVRAVLNNIEYDDVVVIFFEYFLAYQAKSALAAIGEWSK